MNDPSIRPPGATRVLRIVLRSLLLVWAAFWTWFVAMVSLGEAPAPPWWIPAAWFASLAALVVLCWRWPTFGGLVLLAAGSWAGTYFANPGARALLAAPAIGLGLGCVLVGRRACGLASAASVVLLLGSVTLGACRAPQDPADLPFRTGSLLRHPDGALQRAYLVEPTELEGFPCQGWTWWYEDGRLDNLELSRDLTVQGHAFPAATRLFFDNEGRLAHAWLSADVVVDGRPCRGRWKIDTAFHPNGRVRAFFPREPYEIDGVLCTASLFNPIYLHPDGRLKQCKLARDVTLDGRTFRKEERLVLDEAGVPMGKR